MNKIQLSIPEPCHENWDNMTPTQQGRYCNACAKEVIDFSNMSDSEVLNYFLKKKKVDTVCGRAYPDQLERDITALPKRKKYRQWYYMLTAFLFFMKPAKTKAQGTFVVVADSAAPVFKLLLTENTEQQSRQFINAVVKNDTGEAVPFASIKIKGTDRGTSADENGRFSLVKEDEAMKLEISALGYETKEVINGEFNNREIVLVKRKIEMKEVVIQSSICRNYLRGKVGGMRIRRISNRQMAADTIKSWLPDFTSPIKIYPNPVPKSNSFTIHLKLKQTGLFTLQITDAAGRLISEQKINASIKEWKQQLNTNSTWSGGVYYIKVLDDKGKLLHTASLVVQ